MLLFFRSICLVAAVDERIGPAAIGCYMSTFDIDLQFDGTQVWTG